MLKFLINRLASTLPVLGVVAIIVFAMLRMAPGDPVAMIAGENASAADMELMRKTMGLDRALPVQFMAWVAQLFTGDLGYSFFYKMKVTDLIGQRLEPTLSVAVITIVLTVLLSVPLGMLASWRRGSLLDRSIMTFCVAGLSVPVFVAGYVLIWVFAMKLGWLPSQGYASFSQGIGPWLRHLALPCATLAILFCALIARTTRAAVSEALTEDYVRTARAKGISELRLMFRHALPNAAVPIVTVIGLSLAGLIGGMVVTETIYAIPGLGQLTVDAVLSRDYPLIQGITLFFSLLYVGINLLVDLSYLALDPRIRY